MCRAGERKYTFDDIKRKAMSCSSVSKFRTECPTEYNAAYRYGWLKKLYPNYKARRYLSNEEIIAAAKKYEYHGDFYKQDKRCYSAAVRRGMFEQFTWMKRKAKCVDGSPIDSVYIYEFPETNAVYVGRTTRPKLRIYEHTKEDDPVRKYADSIGIAVPSPIFLFTNCTITEGAELEQELIEWYRSIGMQLVNSVKGGGLGALASGKWTKSKCIEYGKRFEYWHDFHKEYPSAVQKIRSEGWRDEFPWLKLKVAPRGTYKYMSEEDASKIASQYPTLAEFSENERALYFYARKRGWIYKWYPKTHGPRKVCAFDLNGLLVGVFDSIKEAAEFAHRDTTSILGVCKGKKHTCAGYRWYYYEDNPFYAKYDKNYEESDCEPIFPYLQETGT